MKMPPTRHTRKILLQALLLGTAIGLGLGLGFALRAARGRGDSTSAVAPSTSAAEASGQTNHGITLRQTVRPHDDSPLATQLERDLASSAGVTRWLHWLDALEKAGPSDFPRLSKLAQNYPAARRLVEARWIEIAPRHLFDLIISGQADALGLPVAQLGEALFDEWPKHDPDAAIAALNEKDQVCGAEHWRWTVAYGLIGKDVEHALKLMVDWHADNVGFGPRGIAAITQWTRANPLHAGEFLLQLPNSYSFQSAIETAGPEWAKIDPAGALTFASSKSGELASELANTVLKNWAERSLDAAADWLSTADDQTRRRLSPTFVETWARKDAPGALAWCEDNVSGSVGAQCIGAVIRGAADKDIATAASLVSSMSASAARAEAAREVAMKWFPGLASDRRATPEAVQWLAGLDPESIGRVMSRISWRWATSDPVTMGEFLAGTCNEQIPPHAYMITAQELARRNPKDALEWAGHLAGATALSAGGAAFGEWRDSQPDAAMNWLNDLPASDPRRRAYLETVVRNLVYHPQGTEQLAAMNAAERLVAVDTIQAMDLPAARRATLLEMLKAR